jgi:hypothetical protein
LLGSVAGLGLAALLMNPNSSQASDHLDAPGVGALTATGPTHVDAPGDLNDVYAWMTADKAKVNLVMTVSPFASTADHFGTNRQYVFHVGSAAHYLGAPTEIKVICTFTADTAIQCWVGTTGYVKGDPSATAGLSSTDGKIKVFAGLRSDPFFFNLKGFKAAIGTYLSLAAGLTPNAAGCPALTVAQQTAVGTLLASDGAGGAATDSFATANVLAISMQVDTTLLNAGGPILGVWASTHAAP